MKKIENFEQNANVANIDYHDEKSIDILDTVQVHDKRRAERSIYQDNTLEGIQNFPAVVLEKLEGNSTKGYDVSLASDLTGLDKLITYKVRVPAIDAMLPLPQTYGGNASSKDKKIINLYSEYSADPQEVDTSPGEFVYVNYRDLKSFTGGQIQGNIEGTAMNGNSYAPSDTQSTAQSFNNAPVSLQNGKKKVLFIGDSHTNSIWGQTVQKLIMSVANCTRVARGGWHSAGYLEGLGFNPLPKNNYEAAYYMVSINDPTKWHKNFPEGKSLDRETQIRLELTYDRNAMKAIISEDYHLAVVCLGTNDVFRTNGRPGQNIINQNIKFLNFLKDNGKKNKVGFISLPAVNTQAADYAGSAWEEPKKSKIISDYIALDKTLGTPKTKGGPIERGSGIVNAVRLHAQEMKQACEKNGFFFIDSVKITQPIANQIGAEVHYYNNPAAVWANGVWAELKQLI